MSLIRVDKHKPIRDALEKQLTKLKHSNVLNSIYKSDMNITNKNMLPSVCVFMDEGLADRITLDGTIESMESELVIKVKAPINSTENGDDELDSIADKVAERINENPTLDDLLIEEIESESFEYLRDPNKIYTCIEFRATIKFYYKQNS